MRLWQLEWLDFILILDLVKQKFEWFVRGKKKKEKKKRHSLLIASLVKEQILDIKVKTRRHADVVM